MRGEGDEAVRGGSTSVDETFMRRALALARRGIGLAAPNPLVGAVVVDGGEIVGEGWHEGPGTAHAEVVALAAAGARARGATLYVTLEPCSHHGRTPPCADAVMRAGVSRVVAAMQDPYPIVDGRGLQALRSAGVAVEVGVLAAEARDLVAPFARHVATGLPLVTLKMAASLDGRVAARDGSSRWITGEAARRDVHLLRAAAGAVVVGAGTAMADDPSLTVRLDGYRGRQPLRVLVDGTGRVPVGLRLFDGEAPTLVATTETAPRSSLAGWAAAGAEIAVLGGEAAAPSRVSLPALVRALGERGVQGVLVEGGPVLAWSAIRSGVVDRLVVYLAPKLVGGAGAPGMLGGEGVATIGEAVRLDVRSVEFLGADVKVVADVWSAPAGADRAKAKVVTGVHGDR